MDIERILETMEYGPAPEGLKPALEWLESHQRSFDLLIGGKWRRSFSGEKLIEVRNPATGEFLAKLTQATSGDVDDAVRVARAALAPWSKLPGHVRARYLYALARQIQNRSRLLAALQGLESGQVIRESRSRDIPMSARSFEYDAGRAILIAEEFPSHRAFGVVGHLSDSGLPLSALARRVAPALAAGNTIVLKPAHETPLVALAFGELCLEVGMPPGVVNIVTGDGLVGEMIATHGGVDMITLAGSTEAGRHLRKVTAGTGKRLIVEVVHDESLFLVFDDADRESAIEGLAAACGFGLGGERRAHARLLVQESVAHGFVERLDRRIQKLRVGDPLDNGVDCAVFSPPHGDVRGEADGGADANGDVGTDGDRVDEFFGPVLEMATFRTPDEAVELANETGQRARASIWTENISLALDVAARVEADTVWINHADADDPAAGPGGPLGNGFGREGGPEGLLEYLRPAREGVERPSLVGEAAGVPRGPIEAPEVGGRPESGDVWGPPGPAVAHMRDQASEVWEGRRGDLQVAVEAALAARKWGKETGHRRARALLEMAEKLAAMADEFAARIVRRTGRAQSTAETEVEETIERLYTYAAWAGTYEGAVRPVAVERTCTLALPVPLGVIGIVCPEEAPLLALISLVAPAIAVGNTVVAIPSERHPFSLSDLRHFFETSYLPRGVVNLVEGPNIPLAAMLAARRDLDAVWYFGPPEGRERVEAAASGNLKRMWVEDGRLDWFEAGQTAGREFLRRATGVKHIWIPYGA